MSACLGVWPARVKRNRMTWKRKRQKGKTCVKADYWVMSSLMGKKPSAVDYELPPTDMTGFIITLLKPKKSSNSKAFFTENSPCRISFTDMLQYMQPQKTQRQTLSNVRKEQRLERMFFHYTCV